MPSVPNSITTDVPRPRPFTKPASVALVGPTVVAPVAATVGGDSVVKVCTALVLVPALLVATMRK